MTTFNRLTNTLNCLENLFKCSLPEKYCLNVLIADSNSSDITEKVIKQKYPDVDIFNVGDNVFWNQGMIKAWKRSIEIKPDFFLWLNNDTYLFKNSLKIIFEDYNKVNSESIVVGTTSYNKKLTYGGRVKLSSEIISPNGMPQKVKFMNGNCVLIPKNVMNNVGILDKKFKHSLGDIDYGLRAIEVGINIYISSKIIGNCEKDNKPWYKHQSLSQRLKNLNSPKGVPFNEYLYFNKRHFGFIKALKFIMATFIALLSPSFYQLIKSK